MALATLASGTNLEALRLMRRRNLVVLAATLASLPAVAARAETRGTLRLGMISLQLQSSSETPLFGAEVDRAVDKYNTAVTARDQATGGMTPRIDASDLGVNETLLLVAPGFEAGGRRFFFRIEAPIGISDDLRSFGLGIYPLNLQAQLRRGLTAYVSAGGAASWLDRPGDGDVGGLVLLRAAAGARVAGRFVAEVGYGAFALGGTVNRAQLDAMTIPDPDTQPADAISAGEARGLVDLSLGVTF